MKAISSTLYYFARTLAQTVCYVLEWIVQICEWPVQSLLRLIFKTEFVRKGGCQMTGQCCRMIGMQFPMTWHKHPRLLQAIRWWHGLRYNFSFKGTVDNMLVYECRYLRFNNQCGIQWRKPKLCREFPQTSLRGLTNLHKGCGFYFERRNKSDFEKILDDVKKA